MYTHYYTPILPLKANLATIIILAAVWLLSTYKQAVFPFFKYLLCHPRKWQLILAFDGHISQLTRVTIVVAKLCNINICVITSDHMRSGLKFDGKSERGMLDCLEMAKAMAKQKWEGLIRAYVIME